MFSLLDLPLRIWDMWPINSLNKYSNLPEDKKIGNWTKKMGRIPSVLAQKKRPCSETEKEGSQKVSSQHKSGKQLS